ncbi:MAG: HAD-IA family hydrolase [Anaerolineae bacterium]|nr:HAD-IA family hydrolase [Anaerolineae bacterium]
MSSSRNSTNPPDTPGDAPPRRILAICLDCGDTLADEATEVKDENGVTLHANLIPGAGALLHELKRRGYPLALVADGPAATFHNILTRHKVYGLFDAFSISELVGVEKPHPQLFLHALEQLRVRREDYGRILMVGNNLARDIKGANQLGLISVWLSWSPRRSHTPADATEVPQFTIATPMELLKVIDEIERRET